MASWVLRSAALWALLAGIEAGPVLALTVPVIVECPDCPASSPVTATLLWDSEAPVEAGETSTLPKGSVEISMPGTVEIDLTPSVLWSLRIFAEGWWSPDARVFVQPPPQGVEPVRLSVSPAGEVEGWARMEDGSPVSDLSLGLAETPGDGKGGHTDLTSETTASGCELQDDGHFRCQVPAGLLDLRLHAPGVASEFRWGVPVGRREVVSLGEIRFVAGASLVGFLTAEEALHLPSSTWVELLPLTAAPASSSAEIRLQRLAQTILPDVRGLFQFQDLRAGTYRLVAGAEGFVETSLSPIQVLEGRESMLREPLSLRRPARVEISTWGLRGNLSTRPCSVVHTQWGGSGSSSLARRESS